MTEDAKPGGPGRRPDQTDFDLVEDAGDAAAFDRALDELLPRGDLGAGGRFEIDPADFEAFNRELDAQMAQAKARSARVDIIEDLGTDVIAPPPGPRREPTPAVPERIGGAVEEPQVADDVVTLGGAAAAPAAAEPPHPETRDVPAQPAAATVAAPPAPVRRGATLALLLGLGGLVAGAAGLWLGLDRQTELARLRSALAERQPAAAVPATATASADAEKIRALEGRLEEVTRRLTELSTAPPTAETAVKTPPPDTHASPRERPSVATSPTTHQHPGAAGPQHSATPTQPAPRPEPESRPAAKEPSTAASEKAEPPQPPPMPASSPPASTAGADSATTEAPAPESPTLPAAASAQPAQALLKPSGNGPWSLVIDSFQDESVAEQRSAQITRMGLPAEVRWELVKDEVRYRVIVSGYATRDAADAAAAELRRRKAGGAWVTRLPKQE